jgi:hypothetical protein
MNNVTEIVRLLKMEQARLIKNSLDWPVLTPFGQPERENPGDSGLL